MEEVKFKIGDKVRIAEEFVCHDSNPSRVTVVRVGDLGTVVGLDSDNIQVRMETGDYAGWVTDVFRIEHVE